MAVSIRHKLNSQAVKEEERSWDESEKKKKRKRKRKRGKRKRGQ